MKLMLFMGVHIYEHHRVDKDMYEAYAKISPFFGPVSEDATKFWDTAGAEFKGSLMFDNAKRAAELPDRRRPNINVTMSPDLWKDWMKISKDVFHNHSKYPMEYAPSSSAVSPHAHHLLINPKSLTNPPS